MHHLPQPLKDNTFLTSVQMSIRQNEDPPDQQQPSSYRMRKAASLAAKKDITNTMSAISSNGGDSDSESSTFEDIRVNVD